MEYANAAIKNLIGLAVEREFHDDNLLSLFLGDGWILSIYNPTQLSHGEEKKSVKELSRLIGATILDAHLSESFLEVRMTDDLRLVVDLSEAAYRGPEAMTLTMPSGVGIVWN